MRNQIILSLMIALPMAAIAQPTLTKPENFYEGASAKFQVCKPVAVGTAGANQVWDFSMLKAGPGDTASISFEAAPAGNIFGANLVAKTSDNVYMYMNNAGASNYLVAMIDSSPRGKDMCISYAADNMLQVQRPLVYNSCITDWFTSNVSVAGKAFKGYGRMILKADAYGTLLLPTGTYRNVLRVRKEQVRMDTFSTEDVRMTRIISYRWYDNAHSFPLLRIDSTIGDKENNITASYLLDDNTATDIATIEPRKMQVYGALHNDALLLQGDLQKNTRYNVAVYNLSGHHIFKTEFTASGNEALLSMNSGIEPGFYVVKLEGDDKSLATLKLIAR